jgi:tRNA nucleotidyltransferase (CCA-adding enzyme)
MRNTDAAYRMFTELVKRNPGVPAVSDFANEKLHRAVKHYNERLFSRRPVMAGFDVFANLFGEPTTDTHDLVIGAANRGGYNFHDYIDYEGVPQVTTGSVTNLVHKGTGDIHGSVMHEYLSPGDPNYGYIGGPSGWDVPHVYKGPKVYVYSMWVHPEMRHTDLAKRAMNSLVEQHPNTPFVANFANEKLQAVTELYNKRLFKNQPVTASLHFASLYGRDTVDTHDLRYHAPHPEGENIYNEFLEHTDELVGSPQEQWDNFMGAHGQPWVRSAGGADTRLAPVQHALAVYEKGVPISPNEQRAEASLDYSFLPHDSGQLQHWSSWRSIHPDYEGPVGMAGDMYVSQLHRDSDMASRIMGELIKRHPGVPFVSNFANQKLRELVERYNQRITRPRVTAAAPIAGPIPWLYDIKGDKILVGHPGDVPQALQGDDYNPMGVVEGVYTPNGSIEISEVTNMPVTVRHLIRLWYYMYPELEVKRVVLHYTGLDGKPKTQRLAQEGLHSQMNQVLATDPAAFAAASALMPHGNVYVVGGAVRDMALGLAPKDVDLMVQGIHPQKLENILSQLPGRVDFTGKAFGVYRYRNPQGQDVEIALPRGEVSTGEGHKDFEVKTDHNLPVEADMDRRDFTGNAMAYDLARQQLIDPHGGWNDLQDRKLRVVNEHSFRDDPLRILRGLASRSRHGLVPDEHTRAEMTLNAPNLQHLPNERIQAELDKIMGGKHPSDAIRLAQETGVLQHFLPEVAATHGFDQRNKHHDRLLFDHTMDVLEHVAKNSNDKDLRYMALLHDIGKPKSQWIDPDTGYAHYYKGKDGQGEDHETLGADMAKAALTRLKFPRARIDRVEHLVRHHMFPEFNTESGARRFMNRVGPEHADDLITMRDGDLAGKPYREQNVAQMQDLLASVRGKGQATTQGNLAISGNDLIAAGMKPGPQMGTLLKYLTDLVIENPNYNDRDKLLQVAAEHM